MNWIIELLFVITAIGLLMARQASRYLWTALLGAGLAYWGVFHDPPAAAMLAAGMLFVLLAALLT